MLGSLNLPLFLYLSMSADSQVNSSELPYQNTVAAHALTGALAVGSSFFRQSLQACVTMSKYSFVLDHVLGHIE